MIRMPKYIAALAAYVMIGVSSDAQAANSGNITVSGTGTCTIPQNISPILVTTYQQNINGVVNTVYNLSIINNVLGPTGKPLTQPQYIVDRLYVPPNATSGTALVFNNGFLGGVTNATWSGTFGFDGFADFTVTNLQITSGTAPNTCTLTFTSGLAIFIGD